LSSINTVIFDLGGVLIDWNPRHLYRKIFNTEEEVTWFLENVCTGEWNDQQDAGRSFEEATEELVQKFPDHEEAIRAWYGRWQETISGPIHGTVEILKSIKDSGKYKVYALTNWSAETFPWALENFEFLHWFDGEARKGALDELSAAARLQQLREASNMLEDLSFDTISAAGPNGASPHYRVNEESNLPIRDGDIYLVDSGGQYRDGTTDVTRTMIVGTPTAEMKDRFTRVLKGHIALARVVFPAGTRGIQLDTLARQFLWAAGVDYNHGTGHGVGSFLSVHEGPQRIAAAWSSQPGNDEPLLAGMILSNEPGYYKAGEYGIRIENLVLVEERQVAGAEKPMLGFRDLTLAPIDRNLIEPSLLEPPEREWLNAYHARVLAEIGPQLDDAGQAWLREATAPV
jgi:phosphoglycolate phosphatase-like HAD superfamily hydrolase